MEHEIKENTDKSGRKEDEQNKKNKQKVSKIKAYLKKHPYMILVVLLLCIALFFLLRETGVISKHVYEEVENLGEREGVCFDNLLLSSVISLYNNTSGEYEHKYLCIFNTGDVYSFEWSELMMWNVYHTGDSHERGYDDTIWSRTENAVYLGRMSKWDIFHLNQYVDDFMIRQGEYYVKEYRGIRLDINAENWNNQISDTNEIEWKYYIVYLYRSKKSGESRVPSTIIESCDMNHLFGDIYEKGELRMKSYDENAIATLELFESSLFYYRWVYMCLHNE